MARIIGIFPRQDQASACIDTLRTYGFGRDKMVVSSFGWGGQEMRRPVADLQAEQDEMGSERSLAETIPGAGFGIVVSLEAPQRDLARVKELMEQSGATDIRLE
jgi:hypothetical protein